MTTETAIRLATPEDAPAMARLLRADAVAELTSRPLGNHYLLVAERTEAQELVAVAMIQIEEQHARLRILAVEPACDDEEVTERIVVVAAALCAACGCEVIEVPIPGKSQPSAKEVN
jgi:N-acetylglutamate synthase-like GNAT family acetyltransferase